MDGSVPHRAKKASEKCSTYPPSAEERAKQFSEDLCANGGVLSCSFSVHSVDNFSNYDY